MFAKSEVPVALAQVVFAKVELPVTESVPPSVVLPETLNALSIVEEPLTKSALVVAPVKSALVAPRLVEVALVKEKLVPLIAVVEAYGNCEAATVELEKKTPWVRILVVVAAVEVPNVLSVVNGNAKFA